MPIYNARKYCRAVLEEAEGDTEYFEHPDGKYWSIVCAGNTTRVKWGKTGEPAVLSEKSHNDDAAAAKFMEKMVRTISFPPVKSCLDNNSLDLIYVLLRSKKRPRGATCRRLSDCCMVLSDEG
jgi:hypothetical protein